MVSKFGYYRKRPQIRPGAEKLGTSNFEGVGVIADMGGLNEHFIHTTT